MVAGTDAWLVGDYEDSNTGNDLVLADHCDGTAWTQVQAETPTLATGNPPFVPGVSVLSDGSMVFAAGNFIAANGLRRTLAEIYC